MAQTNSGCVVPIRGLKYVTNHGPTNFKWVVQSSKITYFFLFYCSFSPFFVTEFENSLKERPSRP
jgi:hypothetical protein